MRELVAAGVFDNFDFRRAADQTERETKALMVIREAMKMSREGWHLSPEAVLTELKGLLK